MAVLSMSVVVDSYSYTLIKIASLKSLIISQEEFLKFQRINEIDKLIIEIDKYYPGLSTAFHNQIPTIVEIEKQLYVIFLKIFEKILTISPSQLRDFLRSLLYRYEIWNLKTLLAGKLANIDMTTIQDEMLMKPEELLQRSKFLKDLLKHDDIAYILRLLSKSRYAQIIERGMYYFSEKREIFLLEALLDKFYVDALHDNLQEYIGLEKRIFTNYVDIIIQKYNLMLIYRCLRNKVPKDLLKQLIIPFGSIFTPDLILKFAATDNVKDFITQLRDFIKNNGQFKKIEILNKGSDSDLVTHLLSILNKSIFQKLTISDVADIDSMTIKRVLSFIFNKENEIYRVLGLFVKVTYKLKE